MVSELSKSEINERINDLEYALVNIQMKDNWTEFDYERVEEIRYLIKELKELRDGKC